MTRKLEELARNHLLTEFAHPRYSFKDKGAGDEGFDLWMTASDEAPRKAELKAHSGVFRRPSTLIERLVFNSELERELFESGETVIVRVFLGEKPIRVFVVTNKILGLGAKLTLEARYVVKGRSDYQDTYTELA